MKKKYCLKHFLIFSFLITAIFITGCAKSSAGFGVQDKEYLVRNVIDGDTIELSNGKHVRYIGIDTPETMKKVGTGWLFEPETYGVAAKEYNRELVYGKKVTLEFDMDKTDRHGRWLAYVYVGDTMANLELVEKGYAIVYTFPPNVRYFDRLLEAQEEARRGKRGIWGEVKEISQNKARENTGRFCAIKGIITNISVSSRKIYLNFGDDPEKDLTALIFTGNLPLFAKEGIAPATDYKGRHVEVVGKIEDDRGPVMIIDNPTQIRLIADEQGASSGVSL
ncbi:MAG: thermonuclease family protein [Candidatus Omnitrophota bacterium]|nr:thermonuclease family protein [Candidatus Omnitrophota bacterium]